MLSNGLACEAGHVYEGTRDLMKGGLRMQREQKQPT